MEIIMSKNVQYAAFIMTYRRNETLANTLKLLFDQTCPPQKILIVDNDPDKGAKVILNSFNNKPVEYFSVGYNSGPAGAAYWGLKLLFEQNWEWVLWVDDDDPPLFLDSIQNIFDTTIHYKGGKEIGVIGAVGANFNKIKSCIERIKSQDVKSVHIVDCIAGNMFPIVNKRTFDKLILPNPNLFFGFEELSFCLRVKNAGFEILISGTEMLRYRETHNRLNIGKPKFKLPETSTLWRQYYSVRNLFTILLKEQKQILGLFVFSGKTIFKSFMGYKNGFAYGNKYAAIHLLGLYHGLIGVNGCTILPKEKIFKEK